MGSRVIPIHGFLYTGHMSAQALSVGYIICVLTPCYSKGISVGTVPELSFQCQWI